MDNQSLVNERAAALEGLDADQEKRLAGYAQLLSRGTGREGADLLHEAYARWLASNVPVAGPAETCRYLSGALKSIRWNIVRHAMLEQEVEGLRVRQSADDEVDPVELGIDLSQRPEECSYAQELFSLCTGDDEELQLMLLAQIDNASREEIQAELGWDTKKFLSVQKRKRRLLIRLMNEGKLR